MSGFFKNYLFIYYYFFYISALEPCSSLGVASAFSANLLPFFFFTLCGAPSYHSGSMTRAKEFVLVRLTSSGSCLRHDGFTNINKE